jgi:Leucine-rich repeat (LRR) protein
MNYLNWNSRNLKVIENLPEGLTKFHCRYNEIKVIENLPESLTEFDCGNCQIKVIENLPESLNYFYCWNNQIEVIENLPIGLNGFYYYGNDLTSVDKFPIDEIKFELRRYSCIKRIQIRIKNNCLRRTKAARRIQKGLYNWVFSAVCKDSTYGINFRIGLNLLQRDGLNENQ